MRHCHARFAVIVAAVLIVGSLGAPRPAEAQGDWFHGLDLEPMVASSDLILAAKVTEVGEEKIIRGGKAESVMQQYQFQPVQVLKGIFAREMLSLTSDDLGGFHADDGGGAIEKGQMRLLFLSRSQEGYANRNRADNLNRSLPPLADANDPLIQTVRTLLTVVQQHDRAKRATILTEGLKTIGGPGAVTLLRSLSRRAVWAVQSPDSVPAVIRQLNDASPEVREAAAETLSTLLQADYLQQDKMRSSALAALVATLDKADPVNAARCAAIDALGATGSPALDSKQAVARLQPDQSFTTLREQAATVRAASRLKLPTSRQPIAALLDKLPLDQSSDQESVFCSALAKLDAVDAARRIMARIKGKMAARLDAADAIQELGNLPAEQAVPALIELAPMTLSPGERQSLAAVCLRVADPKLVPVLRRLLATRGSGIRWYAIDALMKIDTQEAAKTLQPYLRSESDLLRKLKIAERLGAHGIRDGYPYAIEHMSEPYLLEQAVAALAAIKEPKAIDELRRVMENSQDIAWNTAAIRALGALKANDFAPKFLEIVKELHDPLAPAALVALGDLGNRDVLPQVRAGLSSRNPRIVEAAIRSSAKLLKLPEVKDDEIRVQLASLLADADANVAVRQSALNALVALDDPRLDRSLAAAAGDAHLEESELLSRVEKLLAKRKIKLP